MGRVGIVIGRRLVGPAGFALLVSACGSAGLSPSTTSPVPAGQIQGQVMRGPGVDPRSGSTTGVAIPVPGDPIEVKDPEGNVVTHSVTGKDGSFRVDIAPGMYTVVEDICAVKADAEVRSQSVTQVMLTIPNAC